MTKNVISIETDRDRGNMGVKAYNALIFIADLGLLLFRWLYLVLECFYRIIVPVEEIDVSDDIVLITGTGHGIGRELALKYAQLGSTVVCIDINEEGNLDTVKEIMARGGKAHNYICDVTDREKILELSKTITEEVGFVSILINNAGIMPTHSLLQQTENEIRKTFEVNVFAHFWLFQAFLPAMIQKNKGHIVALCSVAGLFGLKNIVPYCGTKFAVRGVMESIAEEIRKMHINSQIKFTTVCPYMADTGLCKRPYIRFENLMRLLKPDEVANAVITAQRRGVEFVSVPKNLMYLDMYTRLFPYKCGQLLVDFLDSGVESDL